MMAGAEVPLYPPVARVTKAEGVIHVHVSTDGHKVISARADEDLKPLSNAAEENARSWTFATHTPTSFTITYRYRLAAECDPNNPTVILKFPTEVEVCMRYTPIY